MGYELHVRRFVDGDETDDVTEDEWFRFVDDALDFEFRDDCTTAPSPGERVAVSGSFGHWTGHPTATSVPFRWSRGEVHVSFADDHIVVGALRVAEALGARVIGDEGEHYTEPLGSEPAWEFDDDDEPGPGPVPVATATDGAPPPIESVPFDFDGEKSLLERVLPRFRRQRRR